MLRRTDGRRGSSIVEFALLCPWYIFLFVGAYDFGFFSYSLIATETAARVGAMYGAASSSAAVDVAGACKYIIGQLQNLPNVGTSVTTCTAAPINVTASLVTGADGTANGDASFTVAYTTPHLIPIPGLLPGSLVVTRTVQMKLRS
jgi:Flp pilus assembly protein TadG